MRFRLAEEAKESPDKKRIEKLWEDIKRLEKLKCSSSLTDDKAYAAICEIYGREFQELMKDV